MFKRLNFVLIAFITTTIFFTSYNTASANDTIKVFVNTKEVVLDQKPIIKNGRTLVPLRFISEYLGNDVKWNPKKKVVTIVYSIENINYTVTLPIGQKTATKTPSSYLYKYSQEDVVHIQSDVPSQIINGRTVVPLRFIGELLGIDVRSDYQNKDIYISSLGVNLIPSDFEKDVYDKELRKVKDFGKPTVNYEKFLALDADHFNSIDLDYLFAKKPSVDLFGAPEAFRDGFNEIIISGPIKTNYLNMMIYKGKDLPILSYPDVTAESTATIKEGMTYDEVVKLFGGPGVLSGKGTLREEYKWVSSTEKGEAYITFVKKDTSLYVTPSPYRSYSWENIY
ncbi:copper amine oxidase N-terminal domain-containing protein [Paenibacillus sp. N3/727]|uniref:copper amine oxidase N-terminal domain-containing protein n=1 Tax=Paenibacillus sp. N3/727 TaxID=2925845 RepID=UPI001F53B2C6|nr:copper amine oxidase N-terminal domain-containing protein [Paenibacillus sp. N3/727]UNK15834.1 copper amine oxidase N-terminal domain-containing protein [Paenibacillus sp. N3/727]